MIAGFYLYLAFCVGYFLCYLIMRRDSKLKSGEFDQPRGELQQQYYRGRALGTWQHSVDASEAGDGKGNSTNRKTNGADRPATCDLVEREDHRWRSLVDIADAQ